MTDIQDLDLGELDFEEISQEEFAIGGTRGSSNWNHDKIKGFATELAEKHTGKHIKMSIDKFYKTFRGDKGAEVVKYTSYYSRKVLIEAFDELGIKAKVKTINTKNNSTQGDLKISILGY